MAYLKAAVAMTLGVYLKLKVIYRLQSFSNGMVCGCQISTAQVHLAVPLQ